ncbi:MAG: GNAT family N-acetyltransferase [Alphaproteobacteria bacterium]
MTVHAVRDALARQGLILRGGFHPGGGDDVPPESGTILLVGNAGPAMWRAFNAARPVGADPLNAWTRQVLAPMAEQHRARVLYPFEGPPYWPFPRWAQRAESIASSPLGMLIHPEFGLWHAWRGAFVFRERLPLPDMPVHRAPCMDCTAQPCLSGCPVSAFGKAGYDTRACAAWIRSPAGADCLSGGCIARHACPVGRTYAYETDQASLHMTSFLAGQPDPGMRLRAYRRGDAATLARLFHGSVHRAAAADYSPEQRNAWAPRIPDEEWMRARMGSCDVVIVESGDVILGFSNLEAGGHVDMFYVHQDWQRRGTGQLLYRRIEGIARRRGYIQLTADVSITARPFFESMGFTVVRQQTVSRDKVSLINFAMAKRLTP